MGPVSLILMIPQFQRLMQEGGGVLTGKAIKNLIGIIIMTLCTILLVLVISLYSVKTDKTLMRLTLSDTATLSDNARISRSDTPYALCFAFEDAGDVNLVQSVEDLRKLSFVRDVYPLPCAPDRALLCVELARPYGWKPGEEEPGTLEIVRLAADDTIYYLLRTPEMDFEEAQALLEGADLDPVRTSQKRFCLSAGVFTDRAVAAAMQRKVLEKYPDLNFYVERLPAGCTPE